MMTYDEAYKKYAKMIYKSAIKYNLTDTCLRDDLVQCGRIGLFNALNTFNPEKSSNFTSWAYTHIKKEMTLYLTENLTTIRRPSNKANDEDSFIPMIGLDAQFGENDTYLDVIPAEDVNGEDNSLNDEQIIQLNKLRISKGKLNDDLQLILKLKFEEEMTFGEIAEIMNTTRQNVCGRYQTAIKKLKSNIEAPKKLNKTKLNKNDTNPSINK